MEQIRNNRYDRITYKTDILVLSNATRFHFATQGQITQ